MIKIVILIMADDNTYEAKARVLNALMTAKECKASNDDVKMIFCGAGTIWLRDLSNEQHELSKLFKEVKDKIAGACEYCAMAFGVKEDIEQTGFKLLNDYEKHVSLRKYISEGYQIVTF